MTSMTNTVTLTVIILLLILLIAVPLILFVMLSAQKKQLTEMREELRTSHDYIGRNVQTDMNDTRTEISKSLNDSRTELSKNLNDIRAEMTKNSTDLRSEIGQKLADQSVQNEQKLENIRNTMVKRIADMQEENSKQLDKMRETVDEKLQTTLEKRIGESFKLVSERLAQVSEGLGEMQNLASGVGDLKKVLSNVKTRGTLGEIQLEAILEEVLAPEQYEQDIATIPDSRDRVEFAIKLPGEDDKHVYLPLDAKFHADAYSNLQDAYEVGDKAGIDAAKKELETRIKSSAKDIRTKYISPPHTTDFAIMFLPFEGLYSEVVRMGLVEVLQRDYKINIAGPTTTAALLNSLQMGFKTLAIQKRSGEVWDVLGAVKTEFGKFQNVLASAQKRINMANDDLDKLIGTRTNQINRKLREVSSLSESVSKDLLEMDGLDTSDSHSGGDSN